MEQYKAKVLKYRLTANEYKKVSEISKKKQYCYNSEELAKLALAVGQAQTYSESGLSAVREDCYTLLNDVVDWHPQFDEEHPPLFSLQVKEFVCALLEDMNYHEDSCLLRDGFWKGIYKRNLNKWFLGKGK